MLRFNPLDRGNSNQISTNHRPQWRLVLASMGFNPLDRGNSNQIGKERLPIIHRC